MANLTDSYGVAGSGGTFPGTGSGAYSTSNYSDNGNKAVSSNKAVRRSPARTSKAAPTTPSVVYSETQGFRTAYPGVEADYPALDASRTA